jgi:hypothetical protein
MMDRRAISATESASIEKVRVNVGTCLQSGRRRWFGGLFGYRGKIEKGGGGERSSFDAT